MSAVSMPAAGVFVGLLARTRDEHRRRHPGDQDRRPRHRRDKLDQRKAAGVIERGRIIGYCTSTRCVDRDGLRNPAGRDRHVAAVTAWP